MGARGCCHRVLKGLSAMCAAFSARDAAKIAAFRIYALLGAGLLCLFIRSTRDSRCVADKEAAGEGSARRCGEMSCSSDAAVQRGVLQCGVVW